MKSIAFVLLLCNLWQDSSNFLSRDTTWTREVLIIGTVHRGNSQISSRSLLRVLEKEKPDIIFIEADTVENINCKNKNVFGLEIAAKLGIWKPSIEQRAVQRYVKKNNKVCVIPYDTVFERKAYIKDFVAHSDMIFTKLDSLYENDIMDEEDLQLYGRYQELNLFFYSQLHEMNLFEINEPAFIDSSRVMTRMKEMILPVISGKYVPDEVPWLRENLAFDNNRNLFMAQYIQKSIADFKAKKIVVLTGLLHKYFLNDYLSPFQKEYQFILTSLK